MLLRDMVEYEVDPVLGCARVYKYVEYLAKKNRVARVLVRRLVLSRSDLKMLCRRIIPDRLLCAGTYGERRELEEILLVRLDPCRILAELERAEQRLAEVYRRQKQLELQAMREM